MEKILIIRLSSIGDIVHCSGVPRVLRKKFPQAEISWLVRSDFAELVAFNPHLNQIITFDRTTGFKGLKNLATKLQDVGFTHIYDAHSNLRSRYLCSKIRAPHFIRRQKPRFKRLLLFWLRINLFKNYNSVESFITPLKKWGVSSDGLGSELKLPNDRMQKVRSLLQSKQSGQKSPQNLSPENTISMAPSAAWAKKRWPLPYWKNLIELTLKQTDLSILILGGPKDIFCKELESINPERVINLQGELSLLESASAVKLSKKLIVADTGLLHMAEAIGVPVVALIGPTPFGYPTKKFSVTLETELWCKPCSKDGRGICWNPTYQKCLIEVKPELVAEHIR